MTDLAPLDRKMSPDIVILREILDARDYGDLSDITDDELIDRFGPQHDALRVLFHEAATLTEDQRQSIYGGYDEAWKSEEFRAAWRAFGIYSGPGVAARRALWAFGVYGRYAGVAAALARRHEIPTDLYALLVGPWVAVTNRPVHPDDAPVVAA